MTWRTIDSAPKDGTIFLGGWYFQKKWVWRLGKWNEYHKAFNQFPSYHGGPFSHWQPLPAPPGAEGVSDDDPGI